MLFKQSIVYKPATFLKFSLPSASCAWPGERGAVCWVKTIPHDHPIDTQGYVS